MKEKQKLEEISKKDLVQMLLAAAVRYFDSREVEDDIKKINGGGDDTAIAKLQNKVLEKIDGECDFEDVSFLSKGAEFAKAVGRIVMSKGLATGNLIAENVIMTNWHVFEEKSWAEDARIEFFYEIGSTPIACPLNTSIFHNNKKLDYAIVGVDRVPLKQITPIQLNDDPCKIMPKEYMYIVQHPDGGTKKVVFRSNRILNFYRDILEYNIDTERGSSGSFVCRSDWVPVGLHNSGVPVTYKNDPTPHAINYATRISAICDDLKKNGFGNLVR